MAADDLSELTVVELVARRAGMAAQLADAEQTLPGVLLHERRRCSSAGCRCRRGELHGPYAYLSVYAGGRSRTLYVPAAITGAVETHVQAGQRNDGLLAEIWQINLELVRRRALE